MTAKTRYFLIGSVMVLIIGLSIGLVAFYGGMPAGLFSSQRGPEELKYLPGDAAVVAYANVRDVMGSELRQRLRRFEGVTDEGRSEFKNETGIDIEQDIDHVVACMGGPSAAAWSWCRAVSTRRRSKRWRCSTAGGPSSTRASASWW
jgi:hypothetical protein